MISPNVQPILRSSAPWVYHVDVASSGTDRGHLKGYGHRMTPLCTDNMARRFVHLWHYSDDVWNVACGVKTQLRTMEVYHVDVASSRTDREHLNEYDHQMTPLCINNMTRKFVHL